MCQHEKSSHHPHCYTIFRPQHLQHKNVGTFTEDRLKAKEAGMDEHIAKPVDVKLLVKVISRLVENSFWGIRNEKEKME